MSKKQKERIVLLDAHAIIHRGYHALPDFYSSETGEPTGALFGVVSMVLNIADTLKPDYMIACFDLPKPTHRHDVFTEYKVGREGPDPELVAQLERARDVFTALNIPIYDKPGFEADDIIGTIVEQTKIKQNIELIIASGDMDTLQLVEPSRVQVYTMRKGMKDTILYDEDAVTERFGFGSDLIPDFKGLRGDPSDNIPGIPGVGEKTATTLITIFGDMDAIYAALENESPKFKEQKITSRIQNLLREHKDDAYFSRELATIRRDAPISFTVPKARWEESVDIAVALKLFRELGFKTLSERIKVRFAGDDLEFVDSEKDDEDKADVAEDFDPVLIRETAIALWVLNSDHTNASFEDILRYADTHKFEEARKYIFDELKKQNLLSVFETIEQPLIPVVLKMEEVGVGLNTKYLKKLSTDYHAQLDKLTARIYGHAGHEFNINSPQQLATVLFDELGLVGKGKTATGKRSTRESELQKLIDDHTIVADILAYRELSKLLSTYIDNLPAMISPADGRLHPTFLQNGAATGRMASQNPGVQNIPIRSDLGAAIRFAFVPAEGYTLAALDYSQIELRAAAFLSGDKKMIDVFKAGGDIHGAVAKEVFGTDDKNARRKAKIINFGILYGMGVNALAKATETSQKEAKQFLKEYKERFPQLHEYMEGVVLDAHKNGYTETLFGRRRYFSGLGSHLPYVRAEAERMAGNAPIQGTATADIIKLAMIKVDKWIKKEKLEDEVRLVLQVHDELVYEVAEDKAVELAQRIETEMESVVPLTQTNGVPLKVDAKIGENWGDMRNVSSTD